MVWNNLFEISNISAMIGWIILVACPRSWRWLGLAPRYIIPGTLAISYALIMMLHLASAEGGFDTILGVRTLFSSDPLLVAGWQHYLIFDLLVGCWLAARMDKEHVSRLLQAPILVTVFMLGPLGWLLGMATIHLPQLFRRA